MPKSKTSQKRKLKQRDKQRKLVKWAERKIDQYDALSDEEKLVTPPPWAKRELKEPKNGLTV